MLLCVDRDKKIVVFRLVPDEEGIQRRQRVGVVQKRDYEVGPELDSLTPEESAELASVIATYKEAALMQARAAALNFPQTVTEVLRYVDEHGADDERKLILTALTEGLRRLRRISAEASSDNG